MGWSLSFHSSQKLLKEKFTCTFGTFFSKKAGKIKYFTCQHVDGDFLSKMYWVRGDGSSSYLSNGKLSRTKGSELLHENITLGWASLDGWQTN